MKRNAVVNKRSQLHGIHAEKVKYFEDLQKSLPDKNREIKELRELMRQDLRNKIAIQKRIDQLRYEIDRIKNRVEETEYYANTAHIIGEYLKYDKASEYNARMDSNKCKYTISDDSRESGDRESRTSDHASPSNSRGSKGSNNIINYFMNFEQSTPTVKTDLEKTPVKTTKKLGRPKKNASTASPRKADVQKSVQELTSPQGLTSQARPISQGLTSQARPIPQGLTSQARPIPQGLTMEYPPDIIEPTDDEDEMYDLDNLEEYEPSESEYDIPEEEKDMRISVPTSHKDSQTKTRVQLHNEYLSILGYKNQKRRTNKWRTDPGDCERCGNTCIPDNRSGDMVCNQCGFVAEGRIIVYGKTYKEEQEEAADTPVLVYKRINHFHQWLIQFQGKETSKIKPEEIARIIHELKKNRIVTLDAIDPPKIKKILKNLKMSAYYHHVPALVSSISNIPAPRLQRIDEERMVWMFHQLQDPYEKYKEPGRKNFLSYSYTLHKFCELLELDDLLPCFPLLKSKEKLKKNDAIWKLCCRDLRWEYIPSDYT